MASNRDLPESKLSVDEKKHIEDVAKRIAQYPKYGEDFRSAVKKSLTSIRHDNALTPQQLVFKIECWLQLMKSAFANNDLQSARMIYNELHPFLSPSASAFLLPKDDFRLRKEFSEFKEKLPVYTQIDFSDDHYREMAKTTVEFKNYIDARVEAHKKEVAAKKKEAPRSSTPSPSTLPSTPAARLLARAATERLLDATNYQIVETAEELKSLSDHHQSPQYGFALQRAVLQDFMLRIAGNRPPTDARYKAFLISALISMIHTCLENKDELSAQYIYNALAKYLRNDDYAKGGIALKNILSEEDRIKLVQEFNSFKLVPAETKEVTPDPGYYAIAEGVMADFMESFNKGYKNYLVEKINAGKQARAAKEKEARLDKEYEFVDDKTKSKKENKSKLFSGRESPPTAEELTLLSQYVSVYVSKGEESAELHADLVKHEKLLIAINRHPANAGELDFKKRVYRYVAEMDPRLVLSIYAYLIKNKFFKDQKDNAKFTKPDGEAKYNRSLMLLGVMGAKSIADGIRAKETSPFADFKAYEHWVGNPNVLSKLQLDARNPDIDRREAEMKAAEAHASTSTRSSVRLSSAKRSE